MFRSFESILILSMPWEDPSSGKCGETRTDANEVCLEPERSNGEKRTNRWTPVSAWRYPWAKGPSIRMVADLTPAIGSGVESTEWTNVKGHIVNERKRKNSLQKEVDNGKREGEKNPPSKFNECAQRVYMRTSIPAQSEASVPPDPDRTFTYAPSLSAGSESHEAVRAAVTRS
jgi:hypothetical protein